MSRFKWFELDFSVSADCLVTSEKSGLAVKRIS